jgi:hypothetical protein
MSKPARAGIGICLGPPKQWILFKLQKKKIWADLSFESFLPFFNL